MDDTARTPPLTNRRPPTLVARTLTGPLHGRVRAPGDRGIGHRALVLGTLAVGETRITGLLEGEGTLRVAAALRALGAEVARDAPGAWRVAGRGVGGLVEPAGVLDLGGSGDAVRLLAGLLASHPLFAVLAGGARLRGRSMRCVTDPLAACGARFASGAVGGVPLAVEGARDALPVACRLPAGSVGAASALLLAGLNAPGQTWVEEAAPGRDHTDRMLRHFGADVRAERTGEGRVVTLAGQPELRAVDVEVPGDLSAAAYLFVAALLVPGSTVTVMGVGLNPSRTGLLDTLREMGADLVVSNRREVGGEPLGDVAAMHGALRGVDVPPGRMLGMAGEVSILAVAASFAAGTTRLRGSGTRGHARLAATAALLAANGVRVEIADDDLIVHGGQPCGGAVAAAGGDPHTAMSALVLGLAAAEPVGVDDGGCINAAMPGLLDAARELGAGIA